MEIQKYVKLEKLNGERGMRVVQVECVRKRLRGNLGAAECLGVRQLGE